MSNHDNPHDPEQMDLDGVLEQMRTEVLHAKFLRSNEWYNHELRAEERHALETALQNLQIIRNKTTGWRSFASSYKSYRIHLVHIVERLQGIIQTARTQATKDKLGKVVEGVAYIDDQVMIAISKAEKDQ